MPKSEKQKLKILYTLDYLKRSSHADHPVGAKELIAMLAGHDIACDRKSVYSDIRALQDYGVDIETLRGKGGGFYIASRNFELPELKLLVDSVQSSKFITYKKTLALIRKIESLASVYEAQLLSRQVYVKNRIKTMNESIYYNVDEIHTGIARDRRIRFRYFDYTVSKERRFRRDGGYYVVSPFALTWDDENYYLVAYDSEAGIIKHFRVDKMLDIGILDEARDGQESFAALDMAEYAKKVFGMFSGREERVRMRFDNQLVGAVLDRLGREAMLIPDGESCFTVTAQVEVSPQFFAWISGFGSLARIVGPDHVVQAMRAHAAEVLAMYE